MKGSHHPLQANSLHIESRSGAHMLMSTTILNNFDKPKAPPIPQNQRAVATICMHYTFILSSVATNSICRTGPSTPALLLR